MRKILYVSVAVVGFVAIAASQSSAADARAVEPKNPAPTKVDASAGDAAAGTACGCTESKSGGEKKEAAARSQVCPIYAYMKMGSYWLYYALRRENNVCTSALSYSGLPRLSGNCTDGLGCPDTVGARDKKARKRPHPHETHPDIAECGVGKPNEPVKENGGKLEPSEVKIVSFYRKDAKDNKPLLAAVYLVKLTPTDFPEEIKKQIPKNPQYEESMAIRIVGMGYQIETGVPDRIAEDGDVMTISEHNKKQSTILVQIKDNEWREYNIILLEDKKEEEPKPKP